MVLKVNHIAIVQSEMVHYIDQKVPVPLTGLGVKVVASQPVYSDVIDPLIPAN